MKKIIVFALVFSFLICLVGSAYAETRNDFYIDPISAETIAGVSYALMDFWGIGFSVSQGTASGMQRFLKGQVNDFADSRGGSIAEVFGTAITKDIAGKLVVGQVTYNAIKEFVESLIEKFGLSDSESVLTPGQADGTFIPSETSSLDKVGVSAVFSVPKEPSTAYPYMNGYQRGKWYYNGQLKFDGNKGSSQWAFTGNWALVYDGAVKVAYEELDGRTGTVKLVISPTTSIPLSLTNEIRWDGTDYIEPNVLNPDKEWTGWVDGYSDPDTNLDDLIGGIFEQAAVGDISIDGEIIDIPVPPPTPVPVDPDTPLQDVPWEGLNDLIDTTGKEIVDSLDDLKDLTDEGAKDIVDSLEGIKDTTEEGVQDIVQSIEGVEYGVKDLTDTITEALTAPEIDEKIFDLRELFPFCIPFDIYHLLQKFDGSPVAPHVQIPIVIPSFGFLYTLDLDFSVWDPVASTMRTVELIVYAIGLAWATSKVIKW